MSDLQQNADIADLQTRVEVLEASPGGGTTEVVVGDVEPTDPSVLLWVDTTKPFTPLHLNVSYKDTDSGMLYTSASGVTDPASMDWADGTVENVPAGYNGGQHQYTLPFPATITLTMGEQIATCDL